MSVRRSETANQDIMTVRGYSLVEMVTVLILIGILAVFAAPRLRLGELTDGTVEPVPGETDFDRIHARYRR